MINTPQPMHRRNRGALLPMLAAGLYVAVPAQAFQFDTGNPDVKATWDNTVKYSAAWRLNNPDATLYSGVIWMSSPLCGAWMTFPPPMYIATWWIPPTDPSKLQNTRSPGIRLDMSGCTEPCRYCVAA